MNSVLVIKAELCAQLCTSFEFQSSSRNVRDTCLFCGLRLVTGAA